MPSGRRQKKEHRYSFEGKIPEDEINNSPDLRFFFSRDYPRDFKGRTIEEVIYNANLNIFG